MRWLIAIGMLAAALAGITAGCEKRAAEETDAEARQEIASAQVGAVDRGKYLVNVVGCNDCHTPLKMGPNGPEPDMSRMLSGHPSAMVMPPPPKLPEGPWSVVVSGTLTAFAGPWGTTYAPNLTPDQNTGMGIWTEEMFVNALRTGKHMGTSRTIQPPMPWRYYSMMTDEDLKAIYAYLRTIPPIENQVPDYVPPAEGVPAHP
jgi:mono/diheme cytochrome c family protein